MSYYSSKYSRLAEILGDISSKLMDSKKQDNSELISMEHLNEILTLLKETTYSPTLPENPNQSNYLFNSADSHFLFSDENSNSNMSIPFNEDKPVSISEDTMTPINAEKKKSASTILLEGILNKEKKPSTCGPSYTFPPPTLLSTEVLEEPISKPKELRFNPKEPISDSKEYNAFRSTEKPIETISSSSAKDTCGIYSKIAQELPTYDFGPVHTTSSNTNYAYPVDIPVYLF